MSLYVHIILEPPLILNNLYDKDVDFKLRLKPAYSTRGNSYKLENYSFHYDVRKFSFCPRVVNVWNSLPDHVVNVATVNMFKAHLDKFWEHQQVVFDFKADRVDRNWKPI